MSKFCVNCGNELVDEAAVCVKCGIMVSNNLNNNINGKKKGLPIWAIILIIVSCIVLIPILILVVIFIVLSIVNYNIFKEVGNEIKDEVNSFIEENKLNTKTGTVGDTLSDDEVNITLNGIYKYDIIGQDSFTEVPENGKEFLLFFFEIENISLESKFVSYLEFEGFVDGVLINNKIISNNVDGQSLLSTNIKTNEKVKGFIAFEVPKSWKEFNVYYDENIFDKSGDLIFKVVNSN